MRKQIGTPGILLGIVGFLVTIIFTSKLEAQIAPGLPFPPPPPPLPDKPRRELPPPLETPQPPSPPPAAGAESLPGPKVFVKQIIIRGVTAFSSEEIAAVTRPYTRRDFSTEDIEALRLALTFFYVSHGYVTSGAVVPDQAIKDGTLVIDIEEGRLADVEIEGNKWFRKYYYQSRIARGAGPPINVNDLQERLQLLQADQRIKRLNAELQPGITRGESILRVRVEEDLPVKVRLEFNNYQTPLVGAEQGFVTLEDQNVLGVGDSLFFQYGRSTGANPLYNIRYSVPLNAYDTTLSGYYRRSVFAITEDPFGPLDIRNDAEIFGISIRQPIYRRLAHELGLSIIFDAETNTSTLLGQPFDFVAGSENGKFRLAVLRFAQDYAYRTFNQVFSVLSRLSFGLDALGATKGNPNATGSADARFFAWLGEAQWVRQLETLRTQLLARTSLQIAQHHLFPLEQIAVGGRYSVRGYREYTFVRDNAWLASLEARVPIYRTGDGIDRLHLAPFVDFGRSWDTGGPPSLLRQTTLASVGVGMIATLPYNSHFEVYWGQQLNHLKLGSGNLQDHGVHLQLILNIL